MKTIKKIIASFHKKINEFGNRKYKKFRKKANKEIYKLLRSREIKNSNEKYILCDALWDSPHHWLRLAIFAPVLAEHLNSKLLGIYLKGIEKDTLETFKELKLDKYIELDVKPDQKQIKLAKKIAKDINSSEDIYNLKLPYGFPGRFLYDSILKNEMIGTIHHKKLNINHYVANLICFLDKYDHLIINEKLSALILSHPVNFRFSTLVFLALKNQIPVYILNYVNEYITIRKLETLDDWLSGSFENPELHEIKKLPQNKIRYLENIGFEYIKNIRESKRGQISTIGTFDSSQEIKFERKKFFEKIDLDHSKLTAVVMTGCWPDFPNIYPHTFYVDYVDWFLKTLDTIKEIDNVNWIIKPHPAEFKYGSKTKTHYFLKNIKSKNIAIWPKEVSSSCLVSVADVLITSHGSAGFEYTALGKPVIITKKTNYADWGFANYCPNYESYKNLLSNLKKLKKPNSDSKTLAYLYIASSICNGLNNNYLFEMGLHSHKLWLTLESFIKENIDNFDTERKFMKKWLNSNSQSYNSFKSLNYDLWNKN